MSQTLGCQQGETEGCHENAKGFAVTISSRFGASAILERCSTASAYHSHNCFFLFFYIGSWNDTVLVRFRLLLVPIATATTTELQF